MAPNRHTTKSPKSGKFVLGRARFEKISEVEGIKLSAAAKKRAEEFERNGTPSAERRKIIINAYRNKG